MYVSIYLLLVPFLIGHLAFWCAIFNQIHATACPKSARRGSEVLIFFNVLFLWMGAVYLAIVYPSSLDPKIQVQGISWVFGQSTKPPAWQNVWITGFSIYWVLCLITAVFMTARWIWRNFIDGKPKFWTDHKVSKFDFDDGSPGLINGFPTKVAFTIVPGNQLLKMTLEEKTFHLESLPKAFDGYRIAHLSDFHLTGRIGKRFFEQIVELTNQQKPDAVFLTGDLLDKTPCLQWIDDIYGGFQSRDGVYFILGNHDRRIGNESALRRDLEKCGANDCNGKYLKITRPNPETEGQIENSASHLWITGNEIPWFSGAESTPDRDQFLQSQNLDPNSKNQFFLAMCHSPDQLHWAQSQGYDLMLAGHTHGGQVRLPIIGPIIAPSRYGVRYASGVFQVDQMAMHVSRGLSGADPLRWNCPPEITIITLKCK